MKSVMLPDEAATELAAGRLATAAAAADVTGLQVALRGPLGAGKTTFVRAVLRALGWAGRVPSPTYTLLEQYEAGGLRVAHLDLYRIADPDELDALGARELLSDTDLIFIEWPEKGAGWLPPAGLDLCLEPVGEGRRLHAVAVAPGAAALVQALLAAPLDT